MALIAKSFIILLEKIIIFLRPYAKSLNYYIVALNHRIYRIILFFYWAFNIIIVFFRGIPIWWYYFLSWFGWDWPWSSYSVYDCICWYSFWYMISFNSIIKVWLNIIIPIKFNKTNISLNSKRILIKYLKDHQKYQDQPHHQFIYQQILIINHQPVKTQINYKDR